MAKKGKMMYVPPVIIEELDNIMASEEITIKADAFRRLGKFARAGREIKQETNLSRAFLPLGNGNITRQKKVKSNRNISDWKVEGIF